MNQETPSSNNKLPVPAAPVLKQTNIKPAINVSNIGRKKPKKQLILILLLPVIIIILIAIVIILSNNNSSQQGYVPPTPIPQPQKTNTVTPNPEPTITPDPNLSPKIETETGNPDWNRLINNSGGYYYDYPSSIKIKESDDYYHLFHPTWYDASHYFDCLNRQIGSTNPYPCWLLKLETNISDLNNLFEFQPDAGKIANLPENMQTYTDGKNRKWQIKGPYITKQDNTYYAEYEYDQRIYQIKSTIINLSLREYLRNHPNRPFAKNITYQQTSHYPDAHLNLIHQILSSFTIFNPPFITKPTWLRHRFNEEWSVAYPENWEFKDLTNENSQYIGILEGWYGDPKFASLHKYSIILETTNLNQYPPSAQQNIDSLAKFEYNQYSEKQKEQITIINRTTKKGHRKNKNVNFYTIAHLNTPSSDLPNLNNDILFSNPENQLYIWEVKNELPPRKIYIKQLNGLYEPKVVQTLLTTFITKIYE